MLDKTKSHGITRLTGDFAREIPVSKCAVGRQ